jgi:hypothetical protein
VKVGSAASLQALKLCPAIMCADGTVPSGPAVPPHLTSSSTRAGRGGELLVPSLQRAGRSGTAVDWRGGQGLKGRPGTAAGRLAILGRSRALQVGRRKEAALHCPVLWAAYTDSWDLAPEPGREHSLPGSLAGHLALRETIVEVPKRMF